MAVADLIKAYVHINKFGVAAGRVVGSKELCDPYIKYEAFVSVKDAIEAESNSVKRIQDQLKMLVMSFDTSSIIDSNGDVVNLLKKLLQLSGE